MPSESSRPSRPTDSARRPRSCLEVRRRARWAVVASYSRPAALRINPDVVDSPAETAAASGSARSARLSSRCRQYRSIRLAPAIAEVTFRLTTASRKADRSASVRPRTTLDTRDGRTSRYSSKNLCAAVSPASSARIISGAGSSTGKDSSQTGAAAFHTETTESSGESAHST